MDKPLMVCRHNSHSKYSRRLIWRPCSRGNRCCRDSMTDQEQIRNIIKENDRRNKAIYAKFNPVTGEGSIGERTKVCLSDFVIPEQWLPNTMMKIPFLKKLIHCGSIDKFLTDVLHVTPNDTDRGKVSKKLIRLRYKHDFAFWAAT